MYAIGCTFAEVPEILGTESLNEFDHCQHLLFMMSKDQENLLILFKPTHALF